MFRFYKIVILVFAPFILFGQTDIKGRILDYDSHEPVPFASVYIDQTTLGTLTDTTGLFAISKVNYPCRLVVSHVGYNTIFFALDRMNLSDSIFYIFPIDISINEISIVNKNLRKNNLKLFKEKFLGDDKWGRNAVIENEDVLKFKCEYDTILANKKNKIKIDSYKEVGVSIQRIENGAEPKYCVPSSVKAYSTEPLIINLPLTGYKLYFDLLEFSMEYDIENDFIFWKYLGYSLYKPLEPKSNSELFRFKRNRLNVYYDSPMHLFRAMCANKLRQNGYAIVERKVDGSSGIEPYIPINTDNWIFENKSLKIVGNKGKNFYVLYFTNINGEPLDLETRKSTYPEQSQMFFISDTCVIRENGTLVGNTILFRPFMGTKQIGASLPNDFKPGPGKL
jgi:hypothetical protein